MNDLRPDLTLSPNRAEELGYDVWDRFVLPSFYDTSDLKYLMKPRVIIGGRGCGKTMLLRYLSHETAFSSRRSEIPKDELAHIGLYWRIDTQFASALTARGVSDDIWQAAFQHLTGVMLALEVIRSVESIAASSLDVISAAEIAGCNFQRLEAFDASLPGTFPGLRARLEAHLWELEVWVNNARRMPPPLFLPGSTFVLAVISLLQTHLPSLAASTFFVYIDEYENLLPYQQELVNTWLKHSESPLVFNIAMKRNAFRTRATTGYESLSEIHDFRRYDLEALESRFDVFAAEVLFMRLSESKFPVPIDVNVLRDPAAVRSRRDPAYIRNVRAAAERLFPQLTEEEIAVGVFKDKALESRLAERIAQALEHRNSRLATAEFMNSGCAAASVIIPALLYRRGLRPELVLAEFRACVDGRSNRFRGKTGWIHNNLFAALLQLYEPLSRACPLYGGFERFTLLAKSNVRHFLELAHKALSRAVASDPLAVSVDVSSQAEAARQASAALLAEVKSFGSRGNQLYTFVLRLGSLFSLAHQRPALSETEQNHFAILRGAVDLDDDLQAFLTEATKWSVLFEERGTKTKSRTDPESVEYVLNPIYAPHFHLSYRKKRRLELRSEEFVTIARGTFDEVRELLRTFAGRWAVGDVSSTQTLFAEIMRPV